MDPVQEKILANPRFKELVARRNRFSFTLTALTLLVFGAYNVMAIFAPTFFAKPFLGLTIWSYGLICGFLVLGFSFLVTGIYTRRANGEFDALLKETLRN